MDEKTLKIQKIRNGIVIDHIPCGRALKVLRILGISGDIGSTVSVAMRVKSEKRGLKDIVKIEDRFLDETEMNKIALIAPNATVNLIEDYKVVEKYRVSLPKEFSGILKCSNPRCITNQGEPVKTEFVVIAENPIIVRCRYCERDMHENEIIENII